MSEAKVTQELRSIPSVTDDYEIEIDLMELLYRLVDQWKIIFLGAFLGTALSAVITLFVLVPTYEATAKLYVMNSNDSAINLSDLQIGSYLTTDYQEVFKTWEVHEMVISNLGLSYTYKQLRNMLTVVNPSNTRVLYITITSEDPKEATMLANEYASVAQRYISNTMSTEQPNSFSVALEPTEPVSPNNPLNIVLGFLLGTFLAIALVSILFMLDDKIKTSEDILKYTNMPTLAMVPTEKAKALTAKGKRR